MRRSLFLLWLAACNGSRDDSGEPGPEPAAPEPRPYVVDDAPPAVVADSTAEIEGSLQSAIDQVFSINAVPVRVAYERVMSGQSAVCPYYYAAEDGSYWFDDCTSSTGTAFEGYIFAYSGDAIVDPYSTALYDYWAAYGGATVRESGGLQLDLGGSAYTYHVYDEGFDNWVSGVSGTFSWDGPEADGTWLEDGVDPDLILTATRITGLGNSVVLDGGYAGIGDGWAVAFDQNLIFDPILGSSCPDEPSGTVSIRSPEGAWYDILFDGPADETVPVGAADCDGCGEAWYRGSPVGTVCADFRPLLAWTAPW